MCTVKDPGTNTCIYTSCKYGKDEIDMTYIIYVVLLCTRDLPREKGKRKKNV